MNMAQGQTQGQAKGQAQADPMNIIDKLSVKVAEKEKYIAILEAQLEAQLAQCENCDCNETQADAQANAKGA